MYGTTDKVAFTYENMRGEEKEFFTEYEGILPMVKRRHSEASTDSMREEFEKFMKLSSLAIKNKELTKAIRKFN